MSGLLPRTIPNESSATIGAFGTLTANTLTVTQSAYISSLSVGSFAIANLTITTLTATNVDTQNLKLTVLPSTSTGTTCVMFDSISSNLTIKTMVDLNTSQVLTNKTLDSSANTLTITNAPLSAANVNNLINQDMRTTASPTFANVCIGQTGTTAPLVVTKNVIVGRKIVMWDGGFNNDHQYYGVGVLPFSFLFQVDIPNAGFVFRAGITASTSQTVLTVGGNGILSLPILPNTNINNTQILTRNSSTGAIELNPNLITSSLILSTSPTLNNAATNQMLTRNFSTGVIERSDQPTLKQLNTFSIDGTPDIFCNRIGINPRKVVLYDNNLNNDHQFNGFGYQTNILRYQVSSNAGADSHVFYSGVSASLSQELFRINGNGNISIAFSPSINGSNTQYLVRNSSTGLLELNTTIQNPFNQSLNTSNAPSFTGMTLSVAPTIDAGNTQYLVRNVSTGVLELNNVIQNPFNQSLNTSNIVSFQSLSLLASAATPEIACTNAVKNRKIVLLGNNNDHQFNGFGVNAGLVRYQSDGAGVSHIFYSAIDSTSSLQLFSISGVGTINIPVSPVTNVGNFNYVVRNASGNLEINTTSANPFNQSLNTTNSPSFNQVSISNAGGIPDIALTRTATNKRKVLLYDNNINNDFQFDGFGINNSGLIYQTSVTGRSHIFNAGLTATTEQNVFNILGTGVINIPIAPTASTNATMLTRASGGNIETFTMSFMEAYSNGTNVLTTNTSTQNQRVRVNIALISVFNTSDFTLSSGVLTYNGSLTKRFQVTYSVSATCASNNRVAEFSIIRTDAFVYQSSIQLANLSNAQDQSISCSSYVALGTGQGIALYIANTSNNSLMTVTRMNINIEQIFN